MAVQQVNMTFLLIALPSFMPLVWFTYKSKRFYRLWTGFLQGYFADWGNLDYQYYSIAQGYTDPDKLVGGWSYGGILTIMS
jgi:hypothetical protein